MILDESTAMLDPEGRAEVMKVITHLNREEGMTVIMITHFMEEASVADRIVVFSDGKVIMDGGKEILLREEELNAVHLSVPFATRIANSLCKNGVNVNGTVTTIEELVNSLCR
jgi:energy-coupling factor transporter ATP-binding protein EcfA2